jgi:hypothetical protein
VLSALNILYCTPTADPRVQEQAHQWLLAWKEKADLSSWNVCFSIFQNPAHQASIHHFTALCLYHFIQSNVQWKLLNPGTVPIYTLSFSSYSMAHSSMLISFPQLVKSKPTDSYASLAAAIFGSLTRKDLNYEFVVKKRLCVMLAGITVRTYPTHWPTFFLDMFYLLNSTDLYETHYVKHPILQSNASTQSEKEQFLAQQQAKTQLPPSLIKSFALAPADPTVTPFALEILRALPEELLAYIIPKATK